MLEKRKYVAMDLLIETGLTKFSKSRNSIIWDEVRTGNRPDDYSNDSFSRLNLDYKIITSSLNDCQIKKYEITADTNKKIFSKKNRSIRCKPIEGEIRVCSGFNHTIRKIDIKKKSAYRNPIDFVDYVNPLIWALAKKYKVSPKLCQFKVFNGVHIINDPRYEYGNTKTNRDGSVSIFNPDNSPKYFDEAKTRPMIIKIVGRENDQ